MLAGHEPAAALLRERGADPGITDVYGQTPARAAAVMTGAKTRPLLSVTNASLGFDPRSVVVLDALPLTVNGKTAKAALREMAS